MKYFLWVIALIISCTSGNKDIESSKTEGLLKINGSDIYYKIIGRGDPVVVVHGGPVLDHTYLLPYFEDLAKNHQVIFYDQRACGQSSLEIDSASMNLNGFAQDIELLRDSLSLGKISVLGHSWGGLIAMKYAINYPDNVTKLILSNSMPASYTHWQEEEQALSKMTTRNDSLKRASIIQSELMQSNPAEAIEKLMMLSFRSQFADTMKLDMLKLNIPDDYMLRSGKFSLLWPDLQLYDFYEDLNRINKKTLIIYGETEYSAQHSALQLQKAIHESIYKTISNSGHFSFIENRESYFKELAEFLQ